MNPMELVKKCSESFVQQRQIQLPTDYELKMLEGYVTALFTYSLFKVGDTVKIAKDYPISKDENWGWLAYRHLFKKGKKAKISKVDWYNNGFQYEVQFLENSWIDEKDVVHKVGGDGYTYFHISEQWLKK